MKLAVDTETTGLSIKHGCRPFMVTWCDENGEGDVLEWQVHTKTRVPVIPPKDITFLQRLMDSYDDGIVFHNCKFDLHALQAIGIKIPKWTRVDDTWAESHVLDSGELHGLKLLAAKYCKYPIEDEKDLHRAIVRARIQAKKLGWSIASGDHPHFKPDSNKAHSGAGWPKADMWLPRQFALHDRLRPLKDRFLTDEEFDLWTTVCRKYAEGDAARTMLLHLACSEAIDEQKLTKNYKLQRAALAPLYSMERKGFPLIPEALKRQTTKLQKLRQKHADGATFIANKFLGTTNFNIRSGDQIKKLLYDTWKLPVLKMTKPGKTKPEGGPSSDFDTMLRLAFGDYPKAKKPHIQKFLRDYLHYSKFNTATTYLQSYDRNRIGPYLYATANNQGTSTTRVSFKNPNLQNIGKGGAASGSDDIEIQLFLEELASDNESLRCVFGPRPGTLWYDIDYSQLQLRIFAFVANEQSLIDAFRAGWDAHTFVARKIFGLRDDESPSKLQRRIAKAVNFGFIFGASPAKIEATAGRPGLWEEVIKLFPSAHQFMDATKRQVRKYGYVHTPGGYRLMCDKAHKGVNFIVQGAEGELVKRAMIETYRYTLETQRRKTGQTQLLLQVHDELIFAEKRTELRYIDTPKKDNPNEMDRKIILPDYTNVNTFCRIMEESGKKFGMETPVDPELILEHWGKSHKLYSCAACNNTGKNSKGGACVPCQTNRKNSKILTA